MIPKHLEEGWKAYRDWWEARYRSGDPLPPGGCFILNRVSVATEQFELMRRAVAEELRVPVTHVLFSLPDASCGVIPQPGWGDFENAYAKATLKKEWENCLSRVEKLVETLNNIREDITQKILPMTEKQK